MGHSERHQRLAGRPFAHHRPNPQPGRSNQRAPEGQIDPGRDSLVALHGLQKEGASRSWPLRLPVLLIGPFEASKRVVPTPHHARSKPPSTEAVERPGARRIKWSVRLAQGIGADVEERVRGPSTTGVLKL